MPEKKGKKIKRNSAGEQRALISIKWEDESELMTAGLLATFKVLSPKYDSSPCRTAIGSWKGKKKQWMSKVRENIRSDADE